MTIQYARWTTEKLKKRYLRLNNLNQYHQNKFLVNAMDPFNANAQVGEFYAELAKRNAVAVEKIGRELDRRGREKQ
jgi:hypothetical protein